MSKRLAIVCLGLGIITLQVSGCAGFGLAPKSPQPTFAPATQPAPTQVPSGTNTPSQAGLPTMSPSPSATRTSSPQVSPILRPPTPTRTPNSPEAIGPRPPAQVSPIGGINIDCGRVTLTWKLAQAAGGIRDYEVDLERLSNRSFVDDRTWSNILGDYVVLDPNCNAEYRWRIRAIDNSGNQGIWSDYQGFVVRAVK